MVKVLFIVWLLLLSYSSIAQCNVTFTQIDLLCKGVCNGSGTALPTGTAPFSYSWSNGDITTTADSLCAGTHTLTMTDDLGCVAIDSITITQPVDSFTVDAYLFAGTSGSAMCDGIIGWTTFAGTPSYTVSWKNCSSGILYTSLPGFCTGEYYCVFIDSKGCIDSSDCVTVTDPVAGLLDEIGSQSLVVYPNPVKDKVVFSIDFPDGTILEIYNIMGQLISEFELIDGKIDLLLIESGQYILRILLDNEVFTAKITKL